ncbi:MAG: DUF4153 domain-containing protein [Candidatus Kapabacteria bacterium]|nr:DUF4153 domain-containing protein [Candidatus Kapabacteria bacterium]
MSAILTSAYWRGLAISLLRTVRDFPAESLIGIAMAICFGLGVEANGDIRRTALRTGMGLVLALCGSIASTILRRAGRINVPTDMAITAVIGTVGVWHSQSLNFDDASGVVEYAYLVIAAHLLVALAWTTYGTTDRFWVGTTTMFGRMTLAQLFTSLLTSGLTMAVGAVRILFGWMEWSWFEVYLTTFAYSSFMTLFFLSGLPTEERLSARPEVPKITLAFVKYVLAPLIAVFTLILYGYSVKLLSTEMSESMVLYGVILSGVSILAALLSWPLRDDTSPLWQFMHRWLYPLLLPLLLMGAWSLSMRISIEGIDRFTFTLGVLESIAVITIVASLALRTRDPRIPALVSFVVFGLTSVGPIGVNTVVARWSATHPKVIATDESAEVGGVPTAPESLAGISTYNTDERWITTFSYQERPILSDQARIDVNDEGILEVIHFGFKDTLRFDIPALLRKTAKNDTILPPMTAYNRNGTRRATLIVSDIAVYIVTTDTTTQDRRRLTRLQGTVYCEPTVAPHY